MELTYENMKAMIQEYFDIYPSIEGPEDEPKLMEFFAPDYQVRFGSGGSSIICNGEEWAKHLCGHAFNYKAVCHYEPYPLGISIDERKGTATLLLCEEFVHPKTGEWIRPMAFIIAHVELCIHDNKVKAKREYISVLPGYPEDMELPVKFYA